MIYDEDIKEVADMIKSLRSGALPSSWVWVAVYANSGAVVAYSEKPKLNRVEEVDNITLKSCGVEPIYVWKTSASTGNLIGVLTQTRVRKYQLYSIDDIQRCINTLVQHDET